MRPRCFVLLVWLPLLPACGKAPPEPEPRMPQEVRKLAIDELVSKGTFEKLEPSEKPPRLYVKQDFIKLHPEAREKLVSLVHAYCGDLPGNDAKDSLVIAVYDSGTGKKIGQYTQKGLKLEP